MTSRPAIEILREINIRLDRETQKVVRILEKVEFINENDLADKLELKINTIRKSLYVLSGLGLASYIKIKDENKKWWYVYNWRLEKARIYYKYISFLRNQLHEKEKTLAEEQEYAFQCNKCHKKYKYHEGLEYNFSCSKCAGMLKEVKNKKVINELTKDISELLDKIRFEDELAKKRREEELKKEAEIKAAEEKKMAEEKEKKRKAVAKKKKSIKKALPKKKPKPKPKKIVIKPVRKKKSKMVKNVVRSAKRKTPLKKKSIKKKPTKKRR